MTPELSVVMCTYNRCDLLPGAIASVLAQDPSTPPFELLVVDNNSSDGTPGLLRGLAEADPRIRPLFEPRQGLSHARNAGIAAARAPILTFTDDDVRVGPGWVQSILRACREYPEADVVGGKVLPDWPAAPPTWLTPAHWGPLALVDYGNAPVRVSAERPLCLVGANLTVRRRAFDAVGAFSPDLQRVKDGVGSCEDHEFLLRLYRIGRSGIYDPRIEIHAAVQADRLDRAYHRRWHTGHGHFHALMGAEHGEGEGAGTLFGVPAARYRQALEDAAGWVAATVRGRSAEAFAREARLRFFRGYLRTRHSAFRARRESAAAEIGRLARRLAGRVLPPAASREAR
jgi:glycosyltransferase involved in cell wall biosynthesis